MTQQHQHFPWLALIVGLLIGAAGGLYYAWFLNPVELVDVAPSQLVPADQSAYILLISQAYLQDNDLDRAKTRLFTLKVHDLASTVSQEADQALANGRDPDTVRAFTALAEALGGHPRALEIFSLTTQPTSIAENGTPTPTFEGIPTITPTPIVTITPTLLILTSTPTPDIVHETRFNLITLTPIICQDDYLYGQIEVYVNDSDGNGIPGLQVKVEWEGQEDDFYTGLKPEITPGYADFAMEPNKLYKVTLVGLAPAVVGIDSTPCTSDTGSTIIPTYQLVFAPAPDLTETPAP